jgi:hypothetical protein
MQTPQLHSKFHFLLFKCSFNRLILLLVDLSTFLCPYINHLI